MWNTFTDVKEQLKERYKEHGWSAGLEPEWLRREVESINQVYYEKDPGEAKARGIAYVLQNAQIHVDPDSFFADQINHENITLRAFWDQMKRIQKEHTVWEEIVSYPGIDFGHIAPDWTFLMKEGIPGVLRRLKEQRKVHQNVPEKMAYYDHCILVYEAIIVLFERFYKLAKSCHTKKSDFVADNFAVLADSAPETLAQAMQLTLIYYQIQTQLDGVSVRSLGGLDRLYAPFYRNDLAGGRFTEEQLRELTADFLWKINAMEVTANLPFYIGGRDDRGMDATNEYTKVLLEEYRKLDIYDPKIHVMYHKNMDRKTVGLILEMIREGKNSFVFVNVDVAAKALENLGIAKEDAKKVIVYGCYETAAEGTEVPATCGGRINMAKAVELAINNGADSEKGVCGLQTGEDFACFEAFADAVKKQLVYMTQHCMDMITEYEKHYKWLPAPVISATFQSSVERGLDLYSGGAKYNNTSIVGAGLATLTDSLLAVKKLVFEEKKLTFSQLRQVLQSDWKDQEKLRRYCLTVPQKYGNNIPQADAVAVDVSTAFWNCINGRPNGRGGVFRAGMFSVDWRYFMGKATAATPDGRKKGEPLSKNTAAVIGQDKKGVTALLQSMLKLDSVQLPDGYVADAVLHASAVKGEDGMNAFRGLLEAFMNQNGFAIHFNVLDHQVLLRAQEEPDKYRNLQIRLCGWNVHFVNLSKEEQDEFIKQSM